MDMKSLRNDQVELIEKMLMFNKSSVQEDLMDGFNDDEIVWKVLIMDKKSTGIISSVLRVNDLLKKGITVHTSLNAKNRSPLPDVPGLYFVQPIKENIDLIVQDISNDFYLEYYINFTSSISRDLLEYFAEKIAFLGKSDKIKQVYDQYLDFVVTEPEMFSLEVPNVYYHLNHSSTSEDKITAICDDIADKLYNTVLTMDTIPIIRAQIGGAAELVATKLDTKLREYVFNTKSANSNDNSLSNTINSTLERVVLIILDRHIDLSSMVSHSLFYECLVFDVFQMNRNTITFRYKEGQGEEATETTMKVDIEPKDFFWTNNCYLPFPDAVENVEIELNNYKQEADEITKKTGVNNIADLDPSNVNSDTVNIQEAVNKLPELTAKKQIIDSHFKILASLIPQLSEKSLDTFYEIEQEDLDQAKTRTRFLDTLKDDKSSNLEDKLRTFIIMYLNSEHDLPKDFVSEVEKYFETQEYTKACVLKHVFKLKQMMQMSNNLVNKSLNSNQTTSNNTANNHGGDGSALFSGLSSKLYGLAGDKLQGGVGSLVSRVSNLLSERKMIPVTSVVEAIMDPLNSAKKNLESTDSYLYFDPRIKRGAHTQQPKRQSYNKSVVFVVGGGNYVEYQNLQQWAHGNSEQVDQKKVVYGSTAILPPTEFLEEVAQLAK